MSSEVSSQRPVLRPLRALEYEVEIFLQSRQDCDFSRRLRIASVVFPPLGGSDCHFPATVVDADRCELRRVVGAFPDAYFFNSHFVLPDLENISHLPRGVTIGLSEGLAGPTYEQEDESEMNDVSAITARVAERQIDDRFVEPFTGANGPRSGPFVELPNNGNTHEYRHHD